MLELNFSVYNLLSIVTCFVGFLYAFQIGTLKKVKTTGNRYFTLFLTTLSLIVFLFFLIDLHLKTKSLSLIIVVFVIPSILLLGPFMWLYIRSLISYEKGMKPVFHFLPAIIIGAIVCFLGFAVISLPDSQLFLKSKLINVLSVICIGSLVVVFLLQNIVYIFLSIRGYNKHRRKMEQIYSYSEEVDLSWIKLLVLGYVVFIIGMVAVNAIKGENVYEVKKVTSHNGKIQIETLQPNGLSTHDNIKLNGIEGVDTEKNYSIVGVNNKTFYIPKLSFDQKVITKKVFISSPDKYLSAVSNILFNLIILLYIVYTGHNAMKQKTILVSEANDTEPDYEKDRVFSEAQLLVFQKIKEDLLEVMKTEKPYLDHNLNIFSLSKRLNTNSKYLSQVINQEFNKSFVHFINEYRIEEAKQILLVDNNYTIEAQSQMVGFKSKSSFNIAFKRHTGVTPSLFIQGHR